MLNDLEETERPEPGRGRRRDPRTHLERRHRGAPGGRDWTGRGPRDARSPALETTGLRKTYGGTVALDGLDLAVEKGRSSPCSGRTALARPRRYRSSARDPRRRGEIRVDGHDPVRDPQAVRDAIGVTGQFSAVDNLLTGEENLS